MILLSLQQLLELHALPPSFFLLGGCAGYGGMEGMVGMVDMVEYGGYGGYGRVISVYICVCVHVYTIHSSVQPPHVDNV